MHNPFRRITFLDIVTKELKEARLARLASQTSADYYKSQVAFRDAQIDRLEKVKDDEEVSA